MRELYYGTRGDPRAPIVVIGESWGAEELNAKRPFVGISGQELDRLLAEAGISQTDVLFTNVIAEKPHGNETFRFFRPKSSNPNTPRVAGLLPSDLVYAEVRRLYDQLADAPRSLVIAAGNWSLWATSNCTGAEVIREANGRRIPEDEQTYAPNGIMSWRGSMLYCEPHNEFDPSPSLRNLRLLPIIHPAAIQRAWYNRAPTLHDLKSRVPMALRDDWRPQPAPTILSPPTYDDAVAQLNSWLQRANKEPFDLANDIETIQRRFISVIGFADSPSFAMCIPFIRAENPDGSISSYWTVDQESKIIELIRRILHHPNIRIVGQNYIYDTQFIQHWFGVTPFLDFDTMLAQNVVFPGTPKDLSYLSSLYCQYHWHWKEDVKDWTHIDSLQSLMDYNCVDVLRTFEIAQSQKQYIRAIGQEEQMKFKMETSRLCLRMMNRGVLIDRQRSGQLLYDLQTTLSQFYSELLEIIPQSMVKPHKKKGETFWYSSPKQTKELFYDLLGMQIVNNRKTGRPTVGKEALVMLERKYPEFTGIFRRLDYAGSIDNTVHVIRTPVEPDGRMRCSYNPGGTETHRLSSSENVFGRGTNLQNLTKGEEDD